MVFKKVQIDIPPKWKDFIVSEAERLRLETGSCSIQDVIRAAILEKYGEQIRSFSDGDETDTTEHEEFERESA